MPYDTDEPTPGRSREIDAIAHAAAAEGRTEMGVKTNDEDPTNTVNSPLGNVEDPAFKRGTSIPGTKS